jgi:hypothetical protein
MFGPSVPDQSAIFMALITADDTYRSTDDLIQAISDHYSNYILIF